MTWTWVSYGVGCPGFGACCASFITGASCHAGSFNRPSSEIEADEVVETFTAGPSSERALARVAVANNAHTAYCHRFRSFREARSGVTGPGWVVLRLCMSVSIAPPVV